jgi:hypothetical protein
MSKEVNNPIRRFEWLWRCKSKSFVYFWYIDSERQGSLLHRRILGPLYTVIATVDCTTTGGSLYYIDPLTTGKL